MTLLAPWALWFALIGAGVVALYLLKIKRHRQIVPALEFWHELISRTAVRSLLQRLKRWLSLLLWLVIVTCLVLALGNPVLSLGRVKPQAIAVILDNSASMQTQEAESKGRMRLALAQDALRDLTRRRPVSDEWLLIEAGRQPRVLVPWTRDPAAIREAAAAVVPHVGSADLAAGHRLATQMLEGKERPCVVVVSDGGGGQVAQLAAQDESLVYWPVGRADDNLGITALEVRAHRQQAAHYAYVRVVNSGPESIDTRVVFELVGLTHSVEPITVRAGGAWERTVVFNAPAGGVLRAWIDRNDALPADNEAYAILAPIRPASVLLVSAPDEAYFYERALLAMDPLVDAAASRTVSVVDYDAADPNAPAPDLTIFNNCVPRHLPPAGAFIFVNEWPTELSARVVGALPQTQLTLAQRDHPLTRYLSFASVTLFRAKEVDLTQRATVLAQSAAGTPLIFLVQQPDRQSLALAFDVLDSDLPFRNAFPILLRNAVTYLVAEQSAWVRPQYAVGEMIEPLRPLPADVSQVQVARPFKNDVTEVALPVRNGAFLFDQTAECGPLRFAIGDELAFAAVNLTDEQETRIAPVPTTEEPAVRLALSRQLLGTVPWLALAVAASLLIALEWLTYHLRWTE